MIRIRFHGRGGQGVKTASRIVSTAAFLAGYECQDFPVYGAERRGAAVAAYARISKECILERGIIEHPDLIIVADETLLEDLAAGVLSGQDSASALFLNTPSEPSAIGHGRTIPRVLTFDITGRTISILGKASALSAGLGAAAARMIGIVPEVHLLQAMTEEFGHLGIAADVLEKSTRICREVFSELPVVEFQPGESKMLGTVVPVTSQDVIRGTPSIFDAGNAEQRRTGNWRVERPVIDRASCSRCGLCFVQCPDGAISLDEEGYPLIDYDHCKGCMICRSVCPLHIVDRERETMAW
jgi:pyruvate ferredoxin oxidoreductase gamma subunit